MDIFSIRTLADVESMGSEVEITHNLMKVGILESERICLKCGKAMTLRLKNESLLWRCRNGKKECSNVSVRRNSWFSNTKLKFKDVFKLSVMHANGYSNKVIESELQMSGKTVSEFRAFFRELAANINKNQQKIGGFDHIVEIDETCLHARKYGRGTIRKELDWVFGGIDRTTKQVFAELVEKRTKSVLQSVLKKHVDLGSRIYSDQWKGYNGVENDFREHATVNHSVQLVSPDGIHTNTIESFWARLKKPIKANNGTTDRLLPNFIADIVLQENAGADYLKMILKEMIKYKK